MYKNHIYSVTSFSQNQLTATASNGTFLICNAYIVSTKDTVREKKLKFAIWNFKPVYILFFFVSDYGNESKTKEMIIKLAWNFQTQKQKLYTGWIFWPDWLFFYLNLYEPGNTLARKCFLAQKHNLSVKMSKFKIGWLCSEPFNYCSNIL